MKGVIMGYNPQFAIQHILTLDRRRSKTSILLTNVDQKSLETEFLIAICHQLGDKLLSKTLFLVSFDLRPSIRIDVFDCCLPGVVLHFIISASICDFGR